MNHYDVLGVATDDDSATIRRAYLAAARRHHPDFHAGADVATRATNAKHMQRLNESWAVLSNPSTRAAYDRSLARVEDPGVARRAARSAPVPPDGKGWTPRAGDDGWMTDFDAWAEDHDDLAPDRPRSARRDIMTLLPVGLFALAIASVVMGGILTSRVLLALGVVALILSIGLFVFLPVIEMTRGNRRR